MARLQHYRCSVCKQDKQDSDSPYTLRETNPDRNRKKEAAKYQIICPGCVRAAETPQHRCQQELALTG